MRKIALFSASAMLALSLLLCGCGSSAQTQDVHLPDTPKVTRQSVPDFLGANDGELIEKKGDGEPTSYNRNGKQVVSQRKYNEKLFGLDAGVEYFYGDEGKVSEIAAVFAQTKREDLIANMTKELGEPKEKQEKSDETQFCYTWEKGEQSFTLLDPDNADPAVIIRSLKQ